MEFRDAALRIGYPIVLEVRYDDGETNFDTQLERIENSNPDAVLLWGNALEMGLILNQMREMGMDYPVSCFRPGSKSALSGNCRRECRMG